MTVYELSRDQIDELKTEYFYGNETKDNVPDNIIYLWKIPDDIIFEHFNDINFVNDDFCCSCGG